MLGFQNLHQVVFNISQVSSIFSSGSVRVTSSTVSKKPEVDVTCNESFLHTLKILEHSENGQVFKDLPNVKFGPRFEDIQWVYFKDVNFKFTGKKSVKENDFYITCDRKDFKKIVLKNEIFNFTELINNKVNAQKHVLVEPENSSLDRSTWTDDYVSGKSFDENKISGYCSSYNKKNYLQLTTSPILNNMAGTFNAYTYGTDITTIQKRGFKTKRVIELENSRKKGFMSKFAVNFIPFDNKPTPRVEAEDKFSESATVSKILADNSLSSEDKLKLKVSFAEGYMLAANELKKNTSENVSSKFVQFLRKIILLSCAIWALATLFSIRVGNKVMFPFNWGSHDGEVSQGQIGVNFSDVKGIEEVKEELQEIVDFLKNPSKYVNLGGKLPKGVLLVGPPGTGKTLLARAIAGEANVPFFHATGSEFDQIFVGEGARRVRNLFNAAKAKAPAIIFIDEIDSVGSKRKSTNLHPYANQTINQLLSEMDGFSKNEGIIVIGATNRKEELDPALLRPGRFDVEILVPVPDLTARKEILEYYISKILSKGIDIDKIANTTNSCTGADLEAIVNHAAIRAATDGASWVRMEHMEIAREKVMFGPERKYMSITDDDNLRSAYHEGGHTIVAYFSEMKQVHRVTIVPRSKSLGHTEIVPASEILHQTKAAFLQEIDILMGGRAAEEMIYGTSKVSAGAASDIDKATTIASVMIKKYGMSEKVGLRTMDFERQSGQVLEDQVDAEIKLLLQESYERAKNILKKHQNELKLIVDALMRYKTLSSEEISAILGDHSNEKSSSSS